MPTESEHVAAFALCHPRNRRHVLEFLHGVFRCEVDSEVELAHVDLVLRDAVHEFLKHFLVRLRHRGYRVERRENHFLLILGKLDILHGDALLVVFDCGLDSQVSVDEVAGGFVHDNIRDPADRRQNLVERRTLSARVPAPVSRIRFECRRVNVGGADNAVAIRCRVFRLLFFRCHIFTPSEVAASPRYCGAVPVSHSLPCQTTSRHTNGLSERLCVSHEM